MDYGYKTIEHEPSTNIWIRIGFGHLEQLAGLSAMAIKPLTMNHQPMFESGLDLATETNERMAIVLINLFSIISIKFLSSCHVSPY